MQGRPGKCPHCGATFLVPQYEEEQGGDEDDQYELGEEIAADSDSETASDEAAEPAPEEQEIEGFNGTAYESDPFAFDFASITSESAGGGGVGGNPMAGVFQRLWAHKRTGGIVELYLKGGEVIAPSGSRRVNRTRPTACLPSPSATAALQ